MPLIKDAVLYIGRDLDFESVISKVFSTGQVYQSVRTTRAAHELIKKFQYQFVIFDENILYAESSDGIDSISIKLIYKDLIKSNPKAVFIAAFLKMTSFVKTFEKLNHTTLLFKRSDLTPSRLAYSLALLRQPLYRSILIRELAIGKAYPVPIYFLSSDEKNKKIYIEANKVIEKNVLDFMIKNNMAHLYLKRVDFPGYIEFVNSNLKANTIFSIELNKMRDKAKSLFSQLCDDSQSNDILSGNTLLVSAKEICTTLDGIIENFPDLNAALEELPFPRWSTLNHCLNSAIYTLILSKICMLDDRIELAVASLVHDIGLSKVEFNLMVLKEEMKKFSISKRVKAEEHVNFSIEILMNKKFLVSKTIHQAILTHHEKIDGTGTPEGKTIKDLKLFQLLLPIVDIIDESRTIDPGDKEKSFKETFLMIMQKYQSIETMGKLGPALSPDLIKSIASYLKYQ